MNQRKHTIESIPLASIEASTPSTKTRVRSATGFWSFLRTVFIGSAGLAIIGVLATLAGSAWLTANQRAEAEKSQPWVDPSFTTTAVTTGGLLARWMDNDGDLSNGHSYIKGIYDLWKVKHAAEWDMFHHLGGDDAISKLPQLWLLELNADYAAIQKAAMEMRGTRSLLPPKASSAPNKYDAPNATQY